MLRSSAHGEKTLLRIFIPSDWGLRLKTTDLRWFGFLCHPAIYKVRAAKEFEAALGLDPTDSDGQYLDARLADLGSRDTQPEM